MQSIAEFLKSTAGVASSIMTIIGLVTLVLWKPLKKLVDKRKEERKKKAAEETEFRNSMMTFATSTEKRMRQIEDSIDANEKDRIRREMFTFAGECRRGENHTIDEFRHVIAIKEKYDALLKKTNDRNGIFEVEYKYILGVYGEHQKTNDFLT